MWCLIPESKGERARQIYERYHPDLWIKAMHGDDPKRMMAMLSSFDEFTIRRTWIEYEKYVRQKVKDNPDFSMPLWSDDYTKWLPLPGPKPFEVDVLEDQLLIHDHDPYVVQEWLGVLSAPEELKEPTRWQADALVQLSELDVPFTKIVVDAKYQGKAYFVQIDDFYRAVLEAPSGQWGYAISTGGTNYSHCFANFHGLPQHVYPCIFSYGTEIEMEKEIYVRGRTKMFYTIVDIKGLFGYMTAIKGRFTHYPCMQPYEIATIIGVGLKINPQVCVLDVECDPVTQELRDWSILHADFITCEYYAYGGNNIQTCMERLLQCRGVIVVKGLALEGRLFTSLFTGGLFSFFCDQTDEFRAMIDVNPLFNLIWVKEKNHKAHVARDGTVQVLYLLAQHFSFLPGQVLRTGRISSKPIDPLFRESSLNCLGWKEREKSLVFREGDFFPHLHSEPTLGPKIEAASKAAYQREQAGAVGLISKYSRLRPIVSPYEFRWLPEVLVRMGTPSSFVRVSNSYSHMFRGPPVTVQATEIHHAFACYVSSRPLIDFPNDQPGKGLIWEVYPYGEQKYYSRRDDYPFRPILLSYLKGRSVKFKDLLPIFRDWHRELSLIVPTLDECRQLLLMFIVRCPNICVRAGLVSLY